MNTNPSSKRMNAEYQEFLRSEEVSPPPIISEKIIGQVKADLSPGFLKVFGKLTLVHAFMGSISLFFCPQFGISPLGNHGLMEIYMRFGPHACLAACGATFMIGSAILACIVLRPEELRVLRRKEYLQVLGLGIVSLAVFLTVGQAPALTLIAAWLAGMLLSGVAAFELGVRLRAVQWK